MNNCPICKGEFYNTEKSSFVCFLHQNWIITQCKHCGRYAFSYAHKLCPYCAESEKVKPLYHPMEAA